MFPVSRPTLEVSEDTPWWARTTSFQVSTGISVLTLSDKSWQPSLTGFLVCSHPVNGLLEWEWNIKGREQQLQELSWDTDREF